MWVADRSILLGSVIGPHSHSPHTFEINTSGRQQFFFLVCCRGLAIVRVGEHKNRKKMARRVVPGGSAFGSILLGSVMGPHSHSPHTFEITTSARPQCFFFGSLARFDQSSGGGTQRPRQYGLYSGPRWAGAAANVPRLC